MVQRSIAYVLAVTSTASSLSSVEALSCVGSSSSISTNSGRHMTVTRSPQGCIAPTTTTLHLGPLDDTSGEKSYGEQKADSELETLRSKRSKIFDKKKANTKPADDAPSLDALESMSNDDIAAMFDNAEGNVDVNAGSIDVDAMLSRGYTPSFKTKSLVTGPVGMSSGDSGGIFDDEEDEEEGPVFVDWTVNYDDENEFHIPNRIGFSTVDWGNSKAGFVGGKLKKKDRKAGKFNKTDLKRAYEKLQQNGVSFVETSESYNFAENLLSKYLEKIEHGDRPLVGSTFPNPWKQALRTRSLPRRGSKAVTAAAEASCDALGVSSMELYQIANPWYYIGGTSALADGMLDVISDDHSRYVGCIGMSLGRLVKLQKKLGAQGEFVATNQFEFSLTNRQALPMIEACKKLGITPICTNVLDGGLATGKYTSTNPTGGEVSKGEGDMGPYSTRKLEKLDAIFRVQSGLIEKINSRIADKIRKFDNGKAPKMNMDVTTTQIAINYVKAKGAVPLVSVTNVKMANELLGCLGWDLSEEEVDELDKACKTCGL